MSEVARYSTSTCVWWANTISWLKVLKYNNLTLETHYNNKNKLKRRVRKLRSKYLKEHMSEAGWQEVWWTDGHTEIQTDTEGLKDPYESQTSINLTVSLSNSTEIQNVETNLEKFTLKQNICFTK